VIAPSARARGAVVARFRDAVRLMLPLLVISAVILIPLTYL
jgi:hypothetical protein